MSVNIKTINCDTNGYLVKVGDTCILIDCPVDCEPQMIIDTNPQAILHTHVQAEHCGEWLVAPNIPVFVPKGSEELSKISSRYLSDSNTQWAEDRNWSTLGEEPYGIGGCIIARPTGSPLNVVGILEPGSAFSLGDISFDIIALPGHDRRAIGLYLRDESILFAGDLISFGGHLPNVYDLERSYGGKSGYADLKGSLLRVMALAPSKVLPSHGPEISDVKRDIEDLLSRIEWVEHPVMVRGDRTDAQTSVAPLRILSHYREMVPGLFQALLAGNTIVFVDESGEGLIVDPGPCLWGSWDDDCRQFREGLQELENVAGLKRITAILATHYHGDHVQLVDIVKEMYGAPFIATPDVAELLRNPRTYRYPCSLDWYAFPYRSMDVDSSIEYDHPIIWAGREVLPLHTPGHCWAHTGFALEWNGMKVICTGDTLMYGDGPFNVPIPIIYNDTAWPDRSFGITLDALERLSPDILVGGHGYFCMVDDKLISDMRQAYNTAYDKIGEMIKPLSVAEAMTPPGFDEKRELLTYNSQKNAAPLYRKG